MSAKVLRKLFFLTLLIGVLLSMVAVPKAMACGDDYCIVQFNSCRELYCNGTNCPSCINQYLACKDQCPMPEGPPGN
jgi:hypothetical protein